MGDSVFIVAGGPSLSSFDFGSLIDKNTIVINSSIFFVSNPKYFITMDYTWFRKNGIESNTSGIEKQRLYYNSTARKFFVVAFSGPRLIKTEIGVKDANFDLEYDLRLVDETIYSSEYGGIGTSFSDFRCGSDSGYSAIQLAVILGYSKIYLLGMDFRVDRDPSRLPSISVPGSQLRLSHSSKLGSSWVTQISVKKKSHFYMSMNPSAAKDLEKKLLSYLAPYPKMFQEISEKTDCQIFSCSSNSRLNEYIPYVPFEKV